MLRPNTIKPQHSHIMNVKTEIVPAGNERAAANPRADATIAGTTAHRQDTNPRHRAIAAKTNVNIDSAVIAKII